MNKEQIKKLLKAAGYANDIIERVTTPPAEDDDAEPIDVAAIVESYQTDRREFYTQELRADIEKTYEERVKGDRYKAAIKPIENRIRRLASSLGPGVESEISSLDVKESIDKLAELAAEKIKAASSETEAELKEKLKDFETKYLDANAEKARLQTEFEQQLAEAQQGFQAERLKEKADNAFRRKVLNNPKLKDINFGPQTFREDVMKRALDQHGLAIEYNAEKDEVVIAGKDGKAAKTIDGNQRYTDFEDFFIDFAKLENLLPKHNGGKGDDKFENKRSHNGKTFSVEGSSFLDQQMSSED